MTQIFVTKKQSLVQRDKSAQHKLVDGIKKNDPDTIRSIYHEHYQSIKSMVNNFKYISLDPQDVFQEGLTIVVINVRKGSFKGDSNLSTYLYGICRNICLKEYNKKIKTTEIKDVEQEVENDNFDVIKRMIEVKDLLDEKCKTIIDLRFGIGNENDTGRVNRFEKIAVELKITSDTARQRFSRCMIKLKQIMANDSVFNQLID